MTTKESLRKIWKKAEERVAKYIGGKRVPITGRTRGDAPDIEHELLVPEVKYKQKFPNWLHDAMDQAQAASPQVGNSKIPCVVLVEKGSEIKDAYVVFRLEDVKDWWL